MKRQLESQIDELYRLPLGEFTKARNALAKTLSGDDKRQVGSLAKPSLPMWVINQLHWEDPATYDALTDASERLRSAHRAALSGRNVDTRKPEELHRTTVEKAVARATAIGEKREGRLTDAVRDAIRRTLGGLPSDEPAGRLTREPPAAGFSLLTGIKPRVMESVAPTSATDEARPKLRSGRPRIEDPREQRRRQRLAAKQQRDAERKTLKEEERARKEKEKRERAIKKAEQQLREAERRLAELKR